MRVTLVMENDHGENDWYPVKAFFDKKKASQFAEDHQTNEYEYDIMPITVSDSKELYVLGYETRMRDFPAQTLGFSFDNEKIRKMFEELDELITAFRHGDFEVCRKEISSYFKSHGFEFVQDPGNQTLMHPDFVPTSLWCDIVKEI